MNVFDWSGPEFLGFFGVLGIACSLLILFTRHLLETGPIPKLNLKDPYLLAYLRGGHQLCLQTVILSLIDRGLMESHRDTVAAKTSNAPNASLPEIEQRVLAYFSNARKTGEIETSITLKKISEPFEDELKRLRLLPDDKTLKTRTTVLNIFLGLFLFIGFARLAIALSRGRYNVFLLFVIGAIFTGIMIKIHTPRLTRLGKKVLSDFNDMFYNLYLKRNYLKTIGEKTDLAWLMALYGLAAIPSKVYPFAVGLFHPYDYEAQARRDLAAARNSGDSNSGGGSCSSSCGSSGGSSCGSSGGSSCGGGCGGGCGGCGS